MFVEEGSYRPQACQFHKTRLKPCIYLLISILPHPFTTLHKVIVKCILRSLSDRMSKWKCNWTIVGGNITKVKIDTRLRVLGFFFWGKVDHFYISVSNVCIILGGNMHFYHCYLQFDFMSNDTHGCGEVKERDCAGYYFQPPTTTCRVMGSRASQLPALFASRVLDASKIPLLWTIDMRQMLLPSAVCVGRKDCGDLRQ